MKSYRNAAYAFLLTMVLLVWFGCNRTILAQSEAKQTLTEQQALPEQQVSPEPPVLLEQLPYKYYGHSISHKFHRPTCPFGMCISKRHLVLFHFRKEAIEAHFVPCKYCLPPVWWSVHGVILPNKDNTSPGKVIPEHDVEEP